MTPPKMLTSEELKEAERLCERATPGPWTAGSDWSVDSAKWGICNTEGPEDAAFIAASRTLLPRALCDLKRLRELLERAPVPCLHADDGQGFIQSCELDPKPCDGCTWNAERKRALGVGR